MNVLVAAADGAHRLIGTALRTAFGTWPSNPGLWVASAPPLVASLLGAKGAILFYYVLVLMGCDLLSGLLRALIRPEEEVDGIRFLGGFLGKLLMLMVLPVAHAMDFAITLTSVVDAGARPLVMAALIALAAHEGASIVQNVLRVKPDLARALAPLTKVLRHHRKEGS